MAQQISTPNASASTTSSISSPSKRSGSSVFLVVSIFSLVVSLIAIGVLVYMFINFTDRLDVARDELRDHVEGHRSEVAQWDEIRDQFEGLEQRVGRVESGVGTDSSSLGFVDGLYESPFLYSMNLPAGAQRVRFVNDGSAHIERFEANGFAVEVIVTDGVNDFSGYQYLDNPPKGFYQQVAFENYVYEFPNGFCDGVGGCTDPFLAVAAERADGHLIHFLFFGDTEFSAVEHAVMQSVELK